jgi:hypothetical protein
MTAGASLLQKHDPAACRVRLKHEATELREAGFKWRVSTARPPMKPPS